MADARPTAAGASQSGSGGGSGGSGGDTGQGGDDAQGRGDAASVAGDTAAGSGAGAAAGMPTDAAVADAQDDAGTAASDAGGAADAGDAASDDAASTRDAASAFSCTTNLDCASGYCWGDVAASGERGETLCRDRCLGPGDAQHYCNDDDDCCNGRCCVGCGGPDGMCEVERAWCGGCQIALSHNYCTDDGGRSVLWECLRTPTPQDLRDPRHCNDQATGLDRFCCAPDFVPDCDT